MPEHESFLNSENSAIVMVEAAKGEKGTTSSKVAEKYDITQQSASRVIRNLKTKGFLEKGKRTKSQFYKPNYEGIEEYALEEMEGYNEEVSKKDLKGVYRDIIMDVLKFSGKKTSLYDLLYSSALIETKHRTDELRNDIETAKAQGENPEREQGELFALNQLQEFIENYLYPQ